MHKTQEACGLKVRTLTILRLKYSFTLKKKKKVKGQNTTLKKKKHFNDMLWLLFMYDRTNTQAIAKSVTFSKLSKKKTAYTIIYRHNKQ